MGAFPQTLTVGPLQFRICGVTYDGVYGHACYATVNIEYRTDEVSVIGSATAMDAALTVKGSGQSMDDAEVAALAEIQRLGGKS